MQSVQEGYDQWASFYDRSENKTRDLEEKALMQSLPAETIGHALELGCGTGKNTIHLAERCRSLTAVDFSAGMIQKAKQKLEGKTVSFLNFDLTGSWPLTPNSFDWVGGSLFLEHLPDLRNYFAQASAVLREGGLLYCGELHPFKQYAGSKARFDNEKGTTVLDCFTHHISEYLEAASVAGLVLLSLKEYFDEGETSVPPRILSLLFQKPIAVR